jgi:hypothetical protein
MAYIGNTVQTVPFITDTFSGTGAQTAFTPLTRAPAGSASIAVFIAGVYQAPSAYSLNGTTITFSSAPTAGASNIIVLHLGNGSATQVPSDGSVTLNRLASDTFGYINAAFSVANTPSYTANSAATYANSAFLQANTPSQTANSAASYANSGFAVANTVTATGSYANSAFTRANNSINANTGGAITGDLTVTGNTTTLNVSNFLGPIFEKANVVTTGGLTTNVTINVSSSGVILYTGNSGQNATVNFTGLGSAMAVGNVATYAIMVTNNTAPKYVSNVQIDGTDIIPKWSGGMPTTGTSANTDMYTFSIFKTSATPTYNVFAQVSSFF